MTDKKTNKVSIYFKDAELRKDVEHLADYDGVSVTEFIMESLRAYIQGRTSDIEFLRGQEQERIARRQEQGANDA